MAQVIQGASVREDKILNSSIAVTALTEAEVKGALSRLLKKFIEFLLVRNLYLRVEMQTRRIRQYFHI